MRIECIHTGPFGVNTYLLYNDGEPGMLVIDPAGEAEEIARRAREYGKEISHIILTHGHFDHILAVDDIRAMADGKVYIHHEDAPMIGDAVMNQSVRFTGAFTTRADILLEGGETLHIAGEDIEILHTPGHSRGSISLRLGDDMIISGDTLFQRNVGRVDLPGGSMDDLRDSLRLLSELPRALRVYPGHGEPTTIGEEFHGE